MVMNAQENMSHLIRFYQLLSLTLFLLSYPLFASSFSTSSLLLCHHDHSLALLQFKISFSINSSASTDCHERRGITSYPKISSWKDNTDCCSWDGVTCDRVTGHVIGLDLSCSQLQGTIHSSSSLFLLPHLQCLNLAFNDFQHSSISSKFGRFTNLTHFNLSWSNFAGHVPSELSHLSKLVSLDLSFNYNMSVTSGLLRLNNPNLKKMVRNLTELKILALDSVDMSSVNPSSFMNLSSSLKTLTLQFCGLRGKFPNNIFHLPNLQVLYLGVNLDLTGYFPKFNGSSPLKYLDLRDLSFSGELPVSISNLQSLKLLYLSGYNFSESILASFGNLTQISILFLPSNNFSGQIPSSLSKLKHLRRLELSSNYFSGSIPIWLGNLTQLFSLGLSSNNFSGQIPSSLSKLKKLTSLRLSDNHLNGSIPSSLSKLDQLGYFDLSNNHFDGLIPTWFGNFTKLSYLLLSSNNFSGQIPSWLSNFSQLSSLSLSSNHFTGQIPTWLGNLEQLEQLDLSSNNFSGSIPLSLLELRQLNYLNLSINHFNASFPSPGGEQLPWRSLQILDLHSNMLQGPLLIPPPTTAFFSIANNKMTGEIHSLICNASSLEIINLSNNSLTGMIPQCLGYFSKSLSVLDLRMNSFSGTIPKTFGNSNSLRNLNFNGNKLEGPVPQSLVNCTKLEVLDFGNNKINDTFPHWLETLPHLQVLVLQSNRFHGPIRFFKAKHPFPELRIIDLSNNSFSGPLPTRYIKNLMAMKNVFGNKTKPNYMGDDYYRDSVTVTMKGFEFILQKILTIFTTIDFSSNRFQGQIPTSIGNLTSLIVLNFSHNSLMGHIPSSLENLRELESLDLSSNNLIGEIPGQLTSLTFLAVLNLSKNHLLGHIPRGNQFDTFSNDSYSENLGLCGAPLSKKCSDDDPPRAPPSIFNEDNDRGFASGFKWKAAFIGYGCGMIFGLAMGYLIFLTRKPEWFVRMIEGKHHKKVKRSNKSAPRRGRRRN